MVCKSALPTVKLYAGVNDYYGMMTVKGFASVRPGLCSAGGFFNVLGMEITFFLLLLVICNHCKKIKAK